MSKEKPSAVFRILKALLGGLLLLLVASGFLLAVILGAPEKQDTDTAVVQPLLPPAQSAVVSDEADLAALLTDYPVPVLAFLNGAGLRLVNGTAYDVPFEDGYARLVDLTYEIPTGGEIRTRTIYPARALSLVQRENYTLTTAGSYAMAGLQAVRMENSSSIRYHAQNENAVYVLTMPRMESDTAAILRKALQLVSVQKPAE